MKRFSLVLLAIAYLSTARPQERFIDSSFVEYFDWFNDNSPTLQLYKKGSTLHIFKDKTSLMASPHQSAACLMNLPLGTKVINLDDSTVIRSEDQINGYDDVWIRVEVRNQEDTSIIGYVWGADIAKAWLPFHSKDHEEGILLLGVSEKQRTNLTDMQAQIKLVQKGTVVSQLTLNDLCVFEACEASQLIRLHNTPDLENIKIIELSTLMVGCEIGWDKIFLQWNLEKASFEEILRFNQDTDQDPIAATLNISIWENGQYINKQIQIGQESYQKQVQLKVGR